MLPRCTWMEDESDHTSSSASLKSVHLPCGGWERGDISTMEKVALRGCMVVPALCLEDGKAGAHRLAVTTVLLKQNFGLLLVIS